MTQERLDKLSAFILEQLSSMIVMGELKDPRIGSFLTVSHVKLARDFSLARVFISGFSDDVDVDKAVAALNNAAGYIRSVFAKKLKTRVVPKFVFQKDMSIEEGLEITKKIEELFKNKDSNT
ncbi:30S ribosome-binding factor RbfA [Spirochaetia bacterium 38H-sp]|uniref:Ribosome-binding factor A n=1 Tax=Rarispira pelagica TaxID=3141764 RepID=A0ABU9UAW8_9SPIR